MSEDIEQRTPNKRGHWTKEEQQRFVDGLQRHGKDWKKIVECVGTRSSNQVRSHAQKYFLKQMKKNRTYERSEEKFSEAYMMYLQTMSFNTYMRFMGEMHKIFTAPFKPNTEPVKIISGSDEIADEKNRKNDVS